MLTVRFGAIEDMPLLKGVHVIRNGAPLRGSAADPVLQVGIAEAIVHQEVR
jgi:hypothetical protein